MRYGRKGFVFGNFEITKREILASISIIAVMILVWYSDFFQDFRTPNG